MKSQPCPCIEPSDWAVIEKTRSQALKALSRHLKRENLHPMQKIKLLSLQSVLRALAPTVDPN